jgi:hypothetical protein
VEAIAATIVHIAAITTGITITTIPVTITGATAGQAMAITHNV